MNPDPRFALLASEDPAKVLVELTRAVEARANETNVLNQGLTDRIGARIGAAAAAMASAFVSGGRLFTFANGASGAGAASLASRFRNPGGDAPPLPATSLTDAALLTALSSDVGFDAVFAHQLAAIGRRGDVALAISITGDSPNVLRGLEQAHRMRMLTIGLAGCGGGAMAGSYAVDALLVVPSVSAHRIQEAQTTVCHVLWELTQRALTGAN